MKTVTELKLFNENADLRKRLTEAERLAHNRDLVCQGAIMVFDAIRKLLGPKDKKALDRLVEIYKNDCQKPLA